MLKELAQRIGAIGDWVVELQAAAFDEFQRGGGKDRFREAPPRNNGIFRAIWGGARFH
jgi:hypothetical protein